ncbi:GyrI-like domain-containing protein [Paenibacillus sp. D2_2]|uniref:GyrI-like domain-containing protein n=1 Tax=Paenibacillus sp. D2_2 TaxID=3073092 RepID=UPI0028159A18|nr:GyrI-like domain-containing protein [Paenibacillus sp. D2_2]WMT43326.1 GyrI-like domain-containing protein [Paenibacillus sp. D2_2]
MTVEIVERPELKAAVLRIPRDGRLVRETWSKVAAWLDGHPAVADKEHGYVFIPEWQWATEVTTLWVGMVVNNFDGLPAELEAITISAKRFAKLTVQGDRSQMEAAYAYLFKWFGEGPYERDTREGAFGFEMNRLLPVNPFHIPAEEIDSFDFDIYAPIKEKSNVLAPDRYPGVINVEIRKGELVASLGSRRLLTSRRLMRDKRYQCSGERDAADP